MQKMDDYFQSTNKWFEGKERETLDVCMVCGQKMDTEIQYQNKPCPVRRCPNCGLVFQWYQPTQSVLDQFYNESEAMTQWAEIKQTPEETKRQLKKYEFVYKEIELTKPESILDVGCGNGFFLNNCNTKATRIGIEPNTNASQHCKFSVFSDYTTFVNSIFGVKKFDMITMFGVLEHLKNPIEELERYKKHLSDRGVLCIIVPNVESLVVKTLQNKCSTFCPQHLWFFSFTTLSCLMDRVGLEYGFATTVEPETQPILQAMNGIEPYDKNRKISYPKELDDGLIMNHKGYKIIAFFSKNISHGRPNVQTFSDHTSA